MLSWEFLFSSLSQCSKSCSKLVDVVWAHCQGPCRNYMGAGGFLSWAVNPKAFHLQKMSVNRSKMLKNVDCSWFLLPANWSVGAQVMTWINIRAGFSAAAKCLSTVQPSGSQTLTKIFLLIPQQVLNWGLRSDSCLEPVILKAAPGGYVQTFNLVHLPLTPLEMCRQGREQGWNERHCKVALQLPNNGLTFFPSRITHSWSIGSIKTVVMIKQLIDICPLKTSWFCCHSGKDPVSGFLQKKWEQ